MRSIKITLRQHLPRTNRCGKPITGEEIRKVREETHLNRTALACCLNVTTGFVFQMEREAKRLTGAARTLVNVIPHNGIEVAL